MLLILGCLNTKNRKLLIPVFSFQIILLNDTFINILKVVGPTYQTTYHHLKKITHTYIPNTQLCFFTFEKTLLEIQYQTYFLHYEYFKYTFSQYFLNHNFHTILNNNTQIPLLNMPLFSHELYIHKLCVIKCIIADLLFLQQRIQCPYVDISFCNQEIHKGAQL